MTATIITKTIKSQKISGFENTLLLLTMFSYKHLWLTILLKTRVGMVLEMKDVLTFTNRIIVRTQNFPKKLTYYTSLYAHVRMRIRGVRNISFPETFAYALN